MHCEIHSNLEKHFGLTGIWFAVGKAVAVPLVLVSVSEQKNWMCLSQSSSHIPQEKVIVGFTYRGQIHRREARICDTDCGNDMLQILFDQNLPQELEKEIEKYLRIDSNAERRRGVRYVVGLKENRWILFGLQSQRQRLLAGKSMIDVVISDVSSHGTLVTGEVAPSLVAGREIVNFQVKFVSPQETLILPALVVRIDKPIPKLARYALNFMEPVSISWMRLVDEYAMKLKCD